MNYSAAPIGVAQAAFDAAFKYASERVQFGTPIIGFQMIQQMIADMATDIQAGRILAYWAATLCDSRERVRLEASYAKLFCSQVGVRVVDKAMQIFGGYGFIKEFPIERMYRDIKGIEFGAGTTQIQKLIIVRELVKQIGQLRAMGAPLYSRDLFGFEIFTNIIMWLLVLLVMYYFFFTFKRQGRVQSSLSKWGRIAMMIGFGALFGNTVQGRLAWLIDRFLFLVQDVFQGVIQPWFT